MWNLSFGFFGVQIAYALQSANISRIFATLGADPHDLSFFWILPPLMGMIVQPLVGSFSDKTWCRWGRRKPYLYLGALVAVLGLLSRIYLNAEVYTGTPQWEACQSTCERLFKLGYDLCPNYADLFRGDNGQNPDALKELIFAVDYDNDHAQSYGGTSFLTLAAINSTDITDTTHPNGVNGGWGGLRTTYEFATTYFGVKNPNYETGEYDVVDERGKFFAIKGKTESIENNLYEFTCGWGCLKFNNIPHDMTEAEFNETAKTKAYSDIDFPVIRLAEIYLTYAEACMHLNQSPKGLPYLKLLAERAGVAAPNDYDQDYLLAERARELMWESHRRTDLIRFGKFTSGTFLWPYKGGDSFVGQSFPEYKKLFAIPASQLRANPNLYNPEGY